MENNWEPRVGQKVVALQTASNKIGAGVRKGETCVVKPVSQCKACSQYMADLGIRCELWPGANCRCPECDEYVFEKNASGKALVSTLLLAPISEQYEDMTSEIAQQFKEHPDTVDQPVKILETVN